MTTVSASAWSVRPFRSLWGAGLFSGLGAEIGELALPALAIITLGASPAQASWVRAAMLAPFLLVTLWFGVLVDRRARRPLMIGADLVRGCVLGLVCALALLGWLRLPALVAATALLGTMTVLYQLAEFSFLPHIVPTRHLVDANAKITATQSTIQIAGAGIGGATVQALTAPVAVLANAVGYLASALLISRVRATEPAPSRESAPATARDGLRALARHPVLRSLAAEASIWNFGNEIFLLALTVHILGGLTAGPLILGAIVTAGGAGAVLGSVFSARWTARMGYGRSLLASLVLGNSAPLVGVLASILAPAWLFPILLVANVVSGIGVGVANSQSTSVRQLAVAEDLRGRVNAGYRLVSWGALSAGALLAGALVTVLGAMPAAAAGTALMAVATLPVALSPVRGVRAIEETGADTRVPAGATAP